MASSFRQWESDPLFSAAEVVQDSADRMESTFRLLLHEQSLIKKEHPDAKLLKSIEYYRRDLATALETAKWQLEDFEREVNLSVAVDKSHARENVISRHRQFISAIGEQILNVKKSLRDTSVGDLRSTERVTLDEQDRNGLALFLSGETLSKHVSLQDFEDSNNMRRFLDPTTSYLNGEIVEHNRSEHLHMNGFVHLDKSFDVIDNKLRKVGSHYSMHKNFEASSALQEAGYIRHGEDGSWDPEANEGTSRSFSDENRPRGYSSRMDVFGSLGTLWFTYGSRASKSFTKRWKDGEEQRNSQFHALRGNCRQLSLTSGYIRCRALYSDMFVRVVHVRHWISRCLGRCQRSPYYAEVKQYSMLLIPAIIFTLIVLGILLM